MYDIIYLYIPQHSTLLLLPGKGEGERTGHGYTGKSERNGTSWSGMHEAERSMHGRWLERSGMLILFVPERTGKERISGFIRESLV